MPERLLLCTDLDRTQIPSVLVANSPEDVRAGVLWRAAEVGYLEQLYLAQEGFRGMNGNYSAGILEGIAHFYPSTVDWMDVGRVV